MVKTAEMSARFRFSQGNKKKSLLARKENLLQELKYVGNEIEEARHNIDKTCYFEDDDSSDSDVEFPIADQGPSITQLKSQQSMLQTCLQATQELTKLDLLQEEVSVLVKEPKADGVSTCKEPGLWREVIAECCLDLVPFSIHFYVHQPYRKFGTRSYRALRVAPLKSAQEVELARSVLGGQRGPADAVDVLRSYSVAFRSRRSSLARLADKFGSALYMEPMAEGGYLLKCAGLLELRWSLQNNGSTTGRFHHKMKFDLEYMDEQYIRPISQAHRQLSDPRVNTDERTMLLATIIGTCLEAGGQGASETEAMSEREVMAPPKSLPKKVKSKGKENATDNNKPTKNPVKRPADDTDRDGVKRVKTDNINDNSKENPKNEGKKDDNAAKIDANGRKAKKGDVNKKNTGVKEQDVITDGKTKKTNVNAKTKTTINGTSEKNTEAQTSEPSDKNAKKINQNNVASAKTKTTNNGTFEKNTEAQTSEPSDKNAKKINRNNVASAKESATKTKSVKENEHRKPITESTKAVANTNDKKLEEKSKNSAKTVKQNVQSKNTDKNVAKNSNKVDNVASAKNNPIKQTNVEKNVVSANIITNDAKRNDKEENDASTKNNPPKQTNVEKNVAVANINRNVKESAAKPAEKNEQAKNASNKNNPPKQTNAEKNVASASNINRNVNKDNAAKLVEKSDKAKNSAATKTNENKNKVDKNDIATKQSQLKDKIATKTVDKNDIATKQSQLKNKIATKTVDKNDIATKQSQLKDKISTKTVESTIKPLQGNKLTKTTNNPIATKGKISTNIKKGTVGNTVKENRQDGSKISKIPQKKTLTSKIMKFPLRISPRKMLTNSKLSAASSTNTVVKSVTNIPRLLPKPNQKAT